MSKHVADYYSNNINQGFVRLMGNGRTIGWKDDRMEGRITREINYATKPPGFYNFPRLGQRRG